MGKKTIAFTHDQDVHCSLDYAEPEKLPVGAKKELQRYKISGISAFANEMEEKGLSTPKVSLQFELSQSGTIALIKAEAAVEETYTVEVEVEVEDDNVTAASSNETSLSEDSKEEKVEETTEEAESTSREDNDEAASEVEEKSEKDPEESAESQNDTSAENLSEKVEEPKK